MIARLGTPVPEASEGNKITTNRKLADTGYGYDVIPPEDLRTVNLDFIQSGEGTCLHTADGVIGARQQVPVQVKRFNEISYPSVLRSIPDV